MNKHVKVTLLQQHNLSNANGVDIIRNANVHGWHNINVVMRFNVSYEVHFMS